METIKIKLEMWHSLGVQGYYNPEAIELRKKLRDLQQKEYETRLRLLLTSLDRPGEIQC